MPMPFGTVAAMAVFVGVSVVVGALLAGAGGWRAAAERFPGPVEEPHDTERFRFVSVRTLGGVLGGAAYKSCSAEPLPWGQAAKLTLRGGGGFRVYGRAAAALSSRWERTQ